jgi:hypothetical protein
MNETETKPRWPTKWSSHDNSGVTTVEAHPIAGQEVSITHQSSRGVWCGRDLWSRDEAEFLAWAVRRASLHSGRTYTYDADRRIEIAGRAIAGHEVTVRLYRRTGEHLNSRSYSQYRALFLADAVAQALKVRIGRGW